MLETQLKQLGFNKNEAKVYLALFDLGKVKAGQIIENTGLHRNLVYTALDDLVEKNLVSKVDQNGVAIFSVNSLQSLQAMITEKANIVSEVISELKKKHEEQPRDIMVYEGDEGIKRSRNRALLYDPGDTLYVIGSKASSTPEMEKYWRRFHLKRINKKIGLKILFERGVNSEYLDWRNQLSLSTAKYLPIDIDMPVWFATIKDYLEIGIPGENPLTFGLRNKEAASAIHNFFEYFWNQQVMVESGIDSLKKAIYEMLDELHAGEMYDVLGASAGDENSPVQKLYDQFHADRIKKGVVTNMLVYRESYERIKKRFADCGDPEAKVSNLKSYTSAPNTPMQINMFHNKAFIILYGETPTVLRFEKKEMYDGFKKYFDELWDQESQILYGPEAVRDIWLESLACGGIKFIGGRGYFADRYPKMFAEIEAKARKIKNLKWQNVVDVSAAHHHINNLPWMEARYTNIVSKNPNVIWLWSNKVAVINWTEKDPVIFLSTNKYLVQSYHDYFDELWNKK